MMVWSGGEFLWDEEEKRSKFRNRVGSKSQQSPTAMESSTGQMENKGFSADGIRVMANSTTKENPGTSVSNDWVCKDITLQDYVNELLVRYHDVITDRLRWVRSFKYKIDLNDKSVKQQP